MTRLRLHIDGTWSAQDFAKFFDAVQSLSEAFHRDEDIRAPLETRSPEVSERWQEEKSRLQGVKLVFGSKGFFRHHGPWCVPQGNP